MKPIDEDNVLGILWLRADGVKDLEVLVNDMYSRYVKVFNNYCAGDPPQELVFLAKPWSSVAALDFKQGDLLTRIGKKDSYVIVKGHKMTLDTVVLRCIDASGHESNLDAQDVMKARLPEGVLEVAKAALLAECKCPIKEACV